MSGLFLVRIIMNFTIDEFVEKLFRKNLFTKKEFFSNEKNIRILLLYKLCEKGKMYQQLDFEIHHII